MGSAKGSSFASWGRVVLALLLLPICLGVTNALFLALITTSHKTDIWIPVLAGAACWIVIFSLLPKPMWLYVFGHEVTHALWVWLFGGRVKGIRVAAKGGHVIVTKTNFLISLAPYFFPFYVILVAAGFGLGHAIFGWSEYVVYLHLLIGAAYCFHVTLTWHALKTFQSDLDRQGYTLSLALIWLFNVGFLLIGVPLLTGQVDWMTSANWCRKETAHVIQQITALLKAI